MQIIITLIVLVVVLPIVMLVNKGTTKLMNKSSAPQHVKDAWNDSMPKDENKRLGKGWVAAVLVLAITILIAFISS